MNTQFTEIERTEKKDLLKKTCSPVNQPACATREAQFDISVGIKLLACDTIIRFSVKYSDLTWPLTNNICSFTGYDRVEGFAISQMFDRLCYQSNTRRLTLSTVPHVSGRFLFLWFACRTVLPFSWLRCLPTFSDVTSACPCEHFPSFGIIASQPWTSSKTTWSLLCNNPLCNSLTKLGGRL